MLQKTIISTLKLETTTTTQLGCEGVLWSKTLNSVTSKQHSVNLLPFVRIQISLTEEAKKEKETRKQKQKTDPKTNRKSHMTR